jgi:hypothetical protein
MKYEVETKKCESLIESLKKDLNWHIKRHSVNENKSEDFAWHLNRVNDRLRGALYEIAQILPNESDIYGRFLGFKEKEIKTDIFDDLDVLSNNIEEVVIKGVRYKKVTETKTTWKKIS